METELPRWTTRLDVVRQDGTSDFSGLLIILARHYALHQQAVEFLGPYNAKQRGPTKPYQAPSREQLKASIKQGGVNDFTYLSFINSLERFCWRTKGLRALPTPHPSVIHSIQLPKPAFELSQVKPDSTVISISGIDSPLLAKGILRNPAKINFMILRPKLSKLGTASVKNWEALFFNESHGYIPEWVDTSINPKYAGVYS